MDIPHGLRIWEQRLSWGSSTAQLSFLSRASQYISSTVLGALECTGSWLLQVANWRCLQAAAACPLARAAALTISQNTSEYFRNMSELAGDQALLSDSSVAPGLSL